MHDDKERSELADPQLGGVAGVRCEIDVMP